MYKWRRGDGDGMEMECMIRGVLLWLKCIIRGGDFDSEEQIDHILIDSILKTHERM